MDHSERRVICQDFHEFAETSDASEIAPAESSRSNQARPHRNDVRVRTMNVAYTEGYLTGARSYYIREYKDDISEAAILTINAADDESNQAPPGFTPTTPPTVAHSALSLLVANANGSWYTEGYIDAIHNIQKHFANADEGEEHGRVRRIRFDLKSVEGQQEVLGICDRIDEIQAQKNSLRYEDTLLRTQLARVEREDEG